MPKRVAKDGTTRRGDERKERFHARLARALGRRADAKVSRDALAAAEGLLVASWNVHKCVGTDGRFDPGRVAGVIAEIGADIIALQEAEGRYGRRAGLLDLARLERECGLVPVPVAGAANGHGWRGNVLLHREGTVRDIHQIRLPGLEPRGALVADLDLEDGALRIVAAHLGLLRRSRELQAEAILAAVRARADRPTLVVGDLNEWRIGSRSALRRFAPAFGPLTEVLPSFPSRLPVFALDRILARPHGIITGFAVHDTPLARLASDHLPVKARIDMAAARPQEDDTGAKIAA